MAKAKTQKELIEHLKEVVQVLENSVLISLNLSWGRYGEFHFDMNHIPKKPDAVLKKKKKK